MPLYNGDCQAGSPAIPAKLPALFPCLHPDCLPEGIVDLPLEEVDVSVIGDLDAGVAQQLGDYFHLHPPSV